MRQQPWRAGAAACLVLLLGTGITHARPPHKQALADYFGPFLAKPLIDCRTCHLPDPPGAASDALGSEKPHNAFGKRLAAVKHELRQAGKKTTIADRLDAIADEDSDGDGVSNLLELLTGHRPGDPTDRPTPAELEKARQTLVAFRQAKAAYPWRPFEPVRRPAVPAATEPGWVRNPIDAFVAAEHTGHHLHPAPEAPRAVLLRRLYLDLIGLPPTPDEVHAFLTDPAADAYERVVDRLLDDARYGERWGRHWMDVWRYSDWAGWGKQVRDSQPHIWHWRDWIVESLNADKGYARMVLEMLAADELVPEDPDALRATGYLVRNFKLLSREKWMQDVVDHTAQAFLGVTLGCARCHDHMFDPITQKEYYQVRAIFEPHAVRIDRLPGQLDTEKDGLPRAYDADVSAPTYLYVRGDDRTPDKSKSIPPGVPEALGGRFTAVRPVTLPRFAYAPDKRPTVLADLRRAAEQEIRNARARRDALLREAVTLAVPRPASPLAALPRLLLAGQRSLGLELARLEVRLAQARQQLLEMQLRVEAVEDAGRKGTPEWESAAALAVTTQRIVAALDARRELLALSQTPAPSDKTSRAKREKARADAKAKEEKASAALLELPTHQAYKPRASAVYPATSTGRRLAFARWIADRDNPLTARVAVNHVWLRHFGQALVPSVFDFGRNGQPPTHPALLDWLAAEFMDSGWSFKHLHRLIVTSNTYRQAPTPDPDNAARDPDNRYLWRVAPRRVEAEVVRDCLFAVAGRLDAAMGGPDLDHELGLTVARRSLYFRHAPEKQMDFLRLFDAANATECYQRKDSILPQQALALANSDLTRQLARAVAQELAQRHPDAAAFTQAAFVRVLSRPPSDVEAAECVRYLEQQGRSAADRPARKEALAPDAAARASLVHVLMNHHEFVTIR
jgi:Protein of unknown function (DUF1553)/Protein of unknown function (DUF1549)